MTENIGGMFQANFLLIIVAVIIAFFAIIGYSRGLIKMVVSFLSIFVTVVLVITFLPKISATIKDTEIYGNLKEKTTRVISEKLQSEFGTEALFDGVSDLSGTTDQILQKLHIPESMKGYIKENVSSENFYTVTRENVVGIYANRIGEKVADLLLNCGVFIASYVVILIGIKFLFGVINLISLLPVIHGANKFAGLLLGLVEGVCFVWVFFILMTTFGGAELNETLFPQIQNNELLSVLYENNLLMKFLLK